ncbi:MAG: NHL repeat-containing protein [Solirubrobacterales bacterium]
MIRSFAKTTPFGARTRLAPYSAGAALACALVLTMVFAAGPALALETHAFSGSFGTQGSGAGQLSLGPESGIAVVNASGPTSGFVYVGDTANRRIDVFDPAKPSGEQFIRAWGWGVVNGREELQTCTEATGCVAGLSGIKPGEFKTPNYVAVDDSAGASKGDVYVADPGDNIVQKFDPEGNLIAGWGNNGAAGAPDGQLAISRVPDPPAATGEIAGIAVDASGNLFVADTHGNTLKFTGSGEYLAASSFVREGVAQGGALAVGGSGTLFYLTQHEGSVLSRLPSGEFLGYVAFTHNTGLAINPASEDVFTDGGGRRIEHHPPSCNPFSCEFTDSFGKGHLSSAAGLALDTLAGPFENDIFAADSGDNRIDLFSPTVTPDVTDLPASNLSPAGATLNGKVDPAGAGEVTECFFQYVSQKAFGETGFEDLSSGGAEPCDQATPISAPIAVTVSVTGLYTETAYRYRLVAANANGQNTGLAGAGQTFTTLPSATAVTGQATGITPTSATLNATVDPNGHSAISDCRFEYVKAAFGAPFDFSTATAAPCEQPTPISASTPVTVTLPNLFSTSVYHYRISVTNSDGTTLGEGATFSTPSHLFGTTFSGSGDNSLDEPTDVAINQQSHDVYVADPARHRIEKFTTGGEFILMFGKGVDKTTGGDVCTAESHDTCQPGTSASTPGGFVGFAKGPETGPNQYEIVSRLFLAVDNSSGATGDVYVGDPGDNIVSKFDAEGHLISSWGVSGQLDGSTIPRGSPYPGPFAFINENNEPKPFPAVDGVGVDSAGRLWVLAQGSVIFKFAPDSNFDNAVTFTNRYGGPLSNKLRPVGIALTEGDEFYAREYTGEGVDRFNSSGTESSVGAQAGQVPNGLGLGVDLPTGNLFVTDGGSVREYDPRTGFLGAFGSPELDAAEGVAVDSLSSDVYVADRAAGDVTVFDGLTPAVETGPAEDFTHTEATVTGHLNPLGRGEVTECLFEYGLHSGEYSLGTVPCEPGAPFSGPQTVHARLTGLSTGSTLYYRLRAGNSISTTTGPERSFSLPFVTDLKTGPPTEITNMSIKLTGSYTAEPGLETEYHFEYGKTTAYGHQTPVVEIPGSAMGPQQLGETIEGLAPGGVYHYRVVAENSLGETRGEDETVTTAQAPTIEGVSTSEVTATSAVLHARIDPQGSPTTYHFSYGPTIAYGEATAEDEITGTTKELFEPRLVQVRVEGLTKGITYHFRLSTENQWGSSTSEDQTIEFLPSTCPNAAVRQQTGSAYLPDCRAYELVSPGDAAGTLLFPGGPNPGTATSPSRFTYVGAFSTLPGAGNPINTVGDLYVATRTSSGWVSKYIGLRGEEAGCMGNPPTSAFSVGASPGKIQNWVLTDPDMDHFLDWIDGAPLDCAGRGGLSNDSTWELSEPSNAPYVWGADGTLAGRLPTNLDDIQGAAAAFACPKQESGDVYSLCSGEVTASADLSHFLFSSNKLSFAENETTKTPGLTEAPGSAYDNDVEADSTKLISILPSGQNIPQDPSFALVPPKHVGNNPQAPVEVPGGREEYIRFPAVSADGSHVLMSTASAPTPLECGSEPCPPFTDTPVHLYMRVDEAVTYEIANGAAVNFVSMTPNGSQVYFFSEEHLTGEDLNHEGTSLYMWSENGGSPTLTLISKPNPGSPPEAGNTGNCGASWVEKCGVLTYSAQTYSQQPGGAGGNGLSDSSVASESGDIYFYSPDQLDGDRGVPGAQNLYVYHEGALKFVATLSSGPYCITHLRSGTPETTCSDGPIVRMQVTPDGSHMAFVTASQITSYNSAGHLEMYSYTPATGAMVCDSCNPDGRPATSDVAASQDGLFMTDDGRVFFSTSEALVASDTNSGEDVYEYVEGRPRLITPGTGTVTIPGENLVTLEEVPGLVGVSANGTDVYFSTYDTLIDEDHNGNFLKFYDARTNGGFLQPTPAQPCAAAEECHGVGTEAPKLPAQGTVAELSGGNAASGPHSKHHKRHKRRHKRHRRAHPYRGGK